MITYADILVRLLGTGVGAVLAYAFLRLYYWREERRAALRSTAHTGHPYRAPSTVSGQEPTTDPGEAWQAGVAAERARVLTIVRAVDWASNYAEVGRACKAIVAGVEGTVGK